MPIKVLLVDDDDAFRSVTAIALESEGYQVHEAASGRTALDWLARERPDVIVSDLVMPGMDGREFCRAVRADPRLSGVRLVVLSALIEPDGSNTPPNLLADCCLSKQIQLRQLLGCIAPADQRGREGANARFEA